MVAHSMKAGSGCSSIAVYIDSKGYASISIATDVHRCAAYIPSVVSRNSTRVNDGTVWLGYSAAAMVDERRRQREEQHEIERMALTQSEHRRASTTARLATSSHGRIRVTITKRRAMQAFHLLHCESYTALARRFRRNRHYMPRWIRLLSRPTSQKIPSRTVRRFGFSAMESSRRSNPQLWCRSEGGSCLLLTGVHNGTDTQARICHHSPFLDNTRFPVARSGFKRAIPDQRSVLR
jgi:hypothetical protein